MNRITKITSVAAALALVWGALAPRAALAVPDPNSVIVIERLFNDCPTSILTITDHYPSSLNITDSNLSCGGFANLHVWRYSTDGVNEELFPNASIFHFKCRMWTTGTADGEAGLQITPWWTEVDGRLNCRTTDGEVACFGGRLPFYSFTANYGLHYVKGTIIDLEMTYNCHTLSMNDPGTIEYTVTYNGQSYTSGPLAFDMGNPNEDPPYGLWGILNQAKVGGHVQCFLQGGNPNASFTAEFTKFEFDQQQPVAVEPTSWGHVKALYR
jgi:hypothetical protein